MLVYKIHQFSVAIDTPPSADIPAAKITKSKRYQTILILLCIALSGHSSTLSDKTIVLRIPSGQE